MERTSPYSLYQAARMRAVTAAIIKENATTSSADATPLIKQEADRSMAWLTQAVASGFMVCAYNNITDLKKDKDFDALRDRQDFKKLLIELDDNSMAWLKQAVASGLYNIRDLKNAKHFDALRDRQDFKKLLIELEGKLIELEGKTKK